MGIGPYASPCPWHQGSNLGHDAALRVEELLGPIALHPLLEHLEVPSIGLHVGEGDLMRAECPLDRHAIDLSRPRPPFRRAQHDDGPSRPLAHTASRTRLLLNPIDGAEALLEH